MTPLPLPPIGRRSYWLATAALWALFAAMCVAFGIEQRPALAAALAALQLAALALITSARLRDRGRSAWAMLFVLVPVVGALWLFWEAAVRKGNS